MFSIFSAQPSPPNPTIADKGHSAAQSQRADTVEESSDSVYDAVDPNAGPEDPQVTLRKAMKKDKEKREKKKKKEKQDDGTAPKKDLLPARRKSDTIPIDDEHVEAVKVTAHEMGKPTTAHEMWLKSQERMRADWDSQFPRFSSETNSSHSNFPANVEGTSSNHDGTTSSTSALDCLRLAADPTAPADPFTTKPRKQKKIMLRDAKAERTTEPDHRTMHGTSSAMAAESAGSTYYPHVLSMARSNVVADGLGSNRAADSSSDGVSSSTLLAESKEARVHLKQNKILDHAAPTDAAQASSAYETPELDHGGFLPLCATHAFACLPSFATKQTVSGSGVSSFQSFAVNRHSPKHAGLWPSGSTWLTKICLTGARRMLSPSMLHRLHVPVQVRL